MQFGVFICRTLLFGVASLGSLTLTLVTTSATLRCTRAAWIHNCASPNTWSIMVQTSILRLELMDSGMFPVIIDAHCNPFTTTQDEPNEPALWAKGLNTVWTSLWTDIINFINVIALTYHHKSRFISILNTVLGGKKLRHLDTFNFICLNLYENSIILNWIRIVISAGISTWTIGLFCLMQNTNLLTLGSIGGVYWLFYSSLIIMVF